MSMFVCENLFLFCGNVPRRGNSIRVMAYSEYRPLTGFELTL